ncbi:hypothetical protein Ahia01_000674800 [Argonauta hians]
MISKKSVQQNKKKKKVVKTVKKPPEDHDPPPPPDSPVLPRGQYNLDFLDDLNPFETKTKVGNSPPNSPGHLSVNPFQTKSKVGNSPPNSPGHLNVDPFQSKSKIGNSPPNSPGYLDSDPSKTETKIENTPPYSPGYLDVDPFKTKKQLGNSPPNSPGYLNINPFETKTKVGNSPPNSPGPLNVDLDDVDPFQTKTKVGNSPPNSPGPLNVDLDDVNPFETKTKVGNSPPNSPGPLNVDLDDVNPFETKTKVGNSPPNSPGHLNVDLDDVDPFQTKNKVGNSPPNSLGHLNVDLDVVDPFQTKTKVGNSPPNSPGHLNVDLDDVNPFQTKSKVGNSPPNSAEYLDINPFETKSKVANSPLNSPRHIHVDPLQTKYSWNNSDSFQPNSSVEEYYEENGNMSRNNNDDIYSTEDMNLIRNDLNNQKQYIADEKTDNSHEFPQTLLDNNQSDNSQFDKGQFDNSQFNKGQFDNSQFDNGQADSMLNNNRLNDKSLGNHDISDNTMTAKCLDDNTLSHDNTEGENILSESLLNDKATNNNNIDRNSVNDYQEDTESKRAIPADNISKTHEESFEDVDVSKNEVLDVCDVANKNYEYNEDEENDEDEEDLEFTDALSNEDELLQLDESSSSTSKTCNSKGNPDTVPQIEQPDAAAGDGDDDDGNTKVELCDVNQNLKDVNNLFNTLNPSKDFDDRHLSESGIDVEYEDSNPYQTPLYTNDGAQGEILEKDQSIEHGPAVDLVSDQELCPQKNPEFSLGMSENPKHEMEMDNSNIKTPNLCEDSGIGDSMLAPDYAGTSKGDDRRSDEPISSSDNCDDLSTMETSQKKEAGIGENVMSEDHKTSPSKNGEEHHSDPDYKNVDSLVHDGVESDQNINEEFCTETCVKDDLNLEDKLNDSRETVSGRENVETAMEDPEMEYPGSNGMTELDSKFNLDEYGLNLDENSDSISSNLLKDILVEPDGKLSASSEMSGIDVADSSIESNPNNDNTLLKDIDTSANSELLDSEDKILELKDKNHDLLGVGQNESLGIRTNNGANSMEDVKVSSGTDSNDNVSDDIFSESLEKSTNINKCVSDKLHPTEGPGFYEKSSVTVDELPNDDIDICGSFIKSNEKNLSDTDDDDDKQKTYNVPKNLPKTIPEDLEEVVNSQLLKYLHRKPIVPCNPSGNTGVEESLDANNKDSLLDSQPKKQIINNVPSIPNDKDLEVQKILAENEGCDHKGQIIPSNPSENTGGLEEAPNESQAGENRINNPPKNLSGNNTGVSETLAECDPQLEGQMVHSKNTEIERSLDENTKTLLLESQAGEEIISSIYKNLPNNDSEFKETLAVSDKCNILDSQLEEHIIKGASKNLPDYDPEVKETLPQRGQLGEQIALCNLSENVEIEGSLDESKKGSLLESLVGEQASNNVPNDIHHKVTECKEILTNSDECDIEGLDVHMNPSKNVGMDESSNESDKNLLLESQAGKEIINNVPKTLNDNDLKVKESLAKSGECGLFDSQFEEQMVPSKSSENVAFEESLGENNQDSLLESSLGEQIINKASKDLPEDDTDVKGESGLLDSQYKEQMVPGDLSENHGIVESLDKNNKDLLLESLARDEIIKGVPKVLNENDSEVKEILAENQESDLSGPQLEGQMVPSENIDIGDSLDQTKKTHFLESHVRDEIKTVPKNIPDDLLEVKGTLAENGQSGLLDSQVVPDNPSQNIGFNESLDECQKDFQPESLVEEQLVGCVVPRNISDNDSGDKDVLVYGDNSVSSETPVKMQSNEGVSSSSFNDSKLVKDPLTLNNENTLLELQAEKESVCDQSIVKDPQTGILSQNEGQETEVLPKNLNKSMEDSLKIPDDTFEIIRSEESQSYGNIKENSSENQFGPQFNNEDNFNVTNNMDRMDLSKNSSFKFDKELDKSCDSKEGFEANIEDFVDRNSSLTAIDDSDGTKHFVNAEGNICSDSVKEMTEMQDKDSLDDITESILEEGKMGSSSQKEVVNTVPLKDDDGDLLVSIDNTQKVNKSSEIELQTESLGQCLDDCNLLEKPEDELNTEQNQKMLKDVDHSESNCSVNDPLTNSNQSQDVVKDGHRGSDELDNSLKESTTAGNDILCSSETNSDKTREIKHVYDERDELLAPVGDVNVPMLETNPEEMVPELFERKESKELSHPLEATAPNSEETGNESSSQSKEHPVSLEKFFNPDRESIFASLIIGSQRLASAILGPSAVCPPVLTSTLLQRPLSSGDISSKVNQKFSSDSVKSPPKPPSDNTNMEESSGLSVAQTSDETTGQRSFKSPPQNRDECNEEACISDGDNPSEGADPDTASTSMETTPGGGKAETELPPLADGASSDVSSADAPDVVSSQEYSGMSPTDGSMVSDQLVGGEEEDVDERPLPSQQQQNERPLPSQQQQQDDRPLPSQQQQDDRPLPAQQQQQDDRPLPSQQQQDDRPLPSQQQQQQQDDRPLPSQQQQDDRPLPSQQQQDDRPLPSQQQQQDDRPLPSQQQQPDERPLPAQQQQQDDRPLPSQQQQQQQDDRPLPSQQQQQQQDDRPLPSQQDERPLPSQQDERPLPSQQQDDRPLPSQQQQQQPDDRPLPSQQQQQQPDERPLPSQQQQDDRPLPSQQQQQQPDDRPLPSQQQQQQPDERPLPSQQQQQQPNDRPLPSQQQQQQDERPLPSQQQPQQQQPEQEEEVTTKPVKKKLKGKVLKKKVPAKFPGAANWKVQDGEDDIKIMISEKKPSSSSSVDNPSNIGVDKDWSVCHPVDMVSSYPEQDSPSAEHSPLKEKPAKKSLSKLVKKSKDKIPVVQVPPQIIGQDLVCDEDKTRFDPHSSSSSSPFNCIPLLESSLTSDSYPEMAPDFVAEETDSQDIANEGFVPASEVFNESTAWEMLEKFGEEGNFKDSDQAPQLVYMKLEPQSSPSPPPQSAGALTAGMIDSAGNQHITNGDKGQRSHGNPEGNDYRQMTEPSNKTVNKIYRHHPNKCVDARSGGGGTAAMKRRELDNSDNMSSAAPCSQKEENFDKEEKESDDLEFYHDAPDFAPAMGDSWVEQIHNFTEIEDSSIGLSQDSLEGLSWSHTDSGLVLDTQLPPFRCYYDETNMNGVRYEANSDNNGGGSGGGVAVETSPAQHPAQGGGGGSGGGGDANGTEAIVQLVPDSGKQQQQQQQPQQPTSSDGSQVLKYSQSQWNKMKQEQEVEFQTRLLQKEKDWSKKLAEKERRITDHEKRIMLLDDQCRNLKQSNEDMRMIVAEFEKTISQLQAEREKSKSASQESMETLIRERDQALEDLQSVETAFSDLHRRYEKTKNVVEGFKKNEEILKKCVQDYQQKITRAEQKLTAIRQQAEDKLEQANTEIDKVRRSTSAEIAKLEAALKKSEVQIQSMERTIEQKILDNQQLTAICEELIDKVGDAS